jgi:hypothetical protein
MEHLNALLLGLSNERARLNEAKSENERIIRGVWVAQIEREIEHEEKFLARKPTDAAVESMTDDELLAALLSD